MDPPNSTAAAPLTAHPTNHSCSQGDIEWIIAYLESHVLTDPSMVYAGILWIILAAIVVVYSISHLTGSRVSYLGAHWTKWTIRRRTWRKKHALKLVQEKGHKQPLPLPSNAQILTLTFLVIAAILLTFAGPDYFAPGSTIWNVRDTSTAQIESRALLPCTLSYDMPDYTISKSWWTSGDRTGVIAFALFPLCVLLALKSPPFAILSLPFTVHLYFDKLSWIHKWIGRLIWLISAIHVILWSVQLSLDKRSDTGKIAYTYAWKFPNFVHGWLAFVFLTLLIALSIRPIRRNHYESFYFLHILLVPFTLIFSALHHPAVGWWCWVALAMWAAERIWRLNQWLYINNYLGVILPQSTSMMAYEGPIPNTYTKPEAWEKADSRDFELPQTLKQGAPSLQIRPFHGHTALSFAEVASGPYGDYFAPPGFAHVEFIPESTTRPSEDTVRLRLVTPSYMAWAPGQHFLLSIPAISKFTSHPFTNASVCDHEALTPAGRELVFFISAKNGWTKRLRDRVSQMTAHKETRVAGEGLPANCADPPRGVLLRAYVDGPFGSSARVEWGAYSTVMIVAGGTGVSFGLAVLQYVCLCMAGRKGVHLGGRGSGWGHPDFKTRRVRFIWTIREESHIGWCAAALRRCMAMVPDSELQVDIFVTKEKSSLQNGSSLGVPQRVGEDDRFVPPPFLDVRPSREGRPSSGQRRRRSESVSSVDSHAETFVNQGYYRSSYISEVGELGHEEHIFDFTHFEGDNDKENPDEAQLSLAVEREGGKLQRVASRKIAVLSTAQSSWEGRPETMPLRDEQDGDDESYHRDTNQSHGYELPQIVTSSSVVFSHDDYAHDYSLPDPQISSASQALPHRASGISEIERPSSVASNASIQSDVETLAPLLSKGKKDAEHPEPELDQSELHDIGIDEKHKHKGRPDLMVILAEEVEQAWGPIIVGCCGPLTLSATMRKAVAAQINPGRIRQGSFSSSITLVSEDFEF